jgi:hypothetical protein
LKLWHLNTLLQLLLLLLLLLLLCVASEVSAVGTSVDYLNSKLVLPSFAPFLIRKRVRTRHDRGCA